LTCSCWSWIAALTELVKSATPDAKAAAELKAAQDAEKKAKAAPDKAKLNEFASMLDGLHMPELKGEEAQKILADAKTLLAKVSAFVREKSSKL